MKRTGLWILWGVLLSLPAWAAKMPMMNHGRMLMDMGGKMVMGQNTDQLPPGCRRISEDVKLTVHAGHKYSRDFPGTMFGYDRRKWQVEPCARVTVTLVNEDHIRHQWMLHGLPEEVYPRGMFHLEVTGPGEVTGTFIAPAEDRTYLVHCDITQHTEKGMKAELVVGEGSGDLPGIAGITPPAVVYPDHGEAGGPVAADAGAPTPESGRRPLLSGLLVLGLVLAMLGAPYLFDWVGRRFFGMSGRELNAYLFERIMALFCRLIRLIRSLTAAGSTS
ncbi:hypothetical protein MIT9_P1676 [Methylomarinovum caldicuralii]|uniref:Plastocyanin-like domain-containing protein n=1 Tax=Methylomarinovum caldicuralii TaxID=438856 RepID=A0AAU9CRD0_9GAMM|nr:multicopper oxidase domain-containing protein [Methylomarinovum caldicuralii]BCX82092.1 hypothetical protein MIT9_P1676 [Methylomarinovum caldicuralii]